MEYIRFEPFQTTISPQFWSDLMTYKLHEAKLDADRILIRGRYSSGRWRASRNPTQSQGKPVIRTALQSRINLEFLKKEDRDQVTLNADDPASVLARTATLADKSVYGFLHNTNTIEEFKSLDRNKLLKEYTEIIYARITCQKQEINPAILSMFVLTTFADLKKFKFYYWAAYPSIVQYKLLEELSPQPKSAATLADLAPKPHLMTTKYSRTELKQLALEYQLFSKENSSDSLIFSVSRSDSANQGGGEQEKTWELKPLSEFRSLVTKENEAMIGFVDPCGHQNVAGWPLRNVLVWARTVYPNQSLKVLCFKDENAPILDSVESELQGFEEIYQSVLYDIPNNFDLSPDYKSAGWEKNQNGKLLPKMANLEASMDPVKLASSSLDLNLQLMKWRLVPTLNLDKIADTKCLLFGAGTLGCNVARVLLGWGVKQVTFVDNGVVSYSNPPRQPLFNFSDVGKPKAESAAENMKSIFPGVESRGIQMSIPMPGHYVSPKNEKSVLEDCEKLDQLVQEHDVIFLLTDSRESRWMPTVLGAVYTKIVMCVALGFDSFVVMRHGPPFNDKNPLSTEQSITNQKDYHRLGCYFCNDIVAPVDSMSNRSLDQQCTVTRPGLAPISAGIAVELMTSILQHSQGVYAGAEIPGTSSDKEYKDFVSDKVADNSSTSVLTYDKPVPHQIRGFLGDFKQHLVLGNAYSQCTACSQTVIDAYNGRNTNNFLLNAFNNEKGAKSGTPENQNDANFNYLEWLTGLDELHRKTTLLIDEDDLSFGNSDEEFLSI